MKARTAEVVAKEVYAGWTEMDTPDNLRYDRMVGDISKALANFAREAVEKEHAYMVKWWFAETRAQGLKDGAASMRERAAMVADDRNNSGEPMPTELRAFDIHVAAKAEAFEISKCIRALPLLPPGAEKEGGERG